MNKKFDLIFASSAVIAVLFVFLYYADKSIHSHTSSIGEVQHPDSSENASNKFSILQVWEMPEELKEISANTLVDSTHMACVPDNNGIIYIYNLKSKSVERRIPFGGKGDYRGLSLVGKTFYVLRSDGFLYEIANDGYGNRLVKTYHLPLDAENYTEPMFYDHEHNCLLIGTKQKDLTDKEKKGVYAFDLSAKTMNTHAVFMIDGQYNYEGKGYEDKNHHRNKKKENTEKEDITPSEIAIHPRTKNLYVLNGTKSELLIANSSGQIQFTIHLDKKIFPQPEGMCFTPSGELYISSEGCKKGNGLIAKVQL